jgi:3-oxoadipate enol-lactonase
MATSNLKYSDQGVGLPLLLVHGFPLNRRMWADDAANLSETYRVIAPDLAGFGESPLGAKPFTMERCADDLQDLLDILQVKERIVLLGLSMGGYICFEFVRKHQERLLALILVATHPFLDTDAVRQGRYETADFVRKQGAAALAERLLPKFLGKTSLETKPQVAEKVRKLIGSNSAENIAAACLGLASRRDSTQLLSRISVPTLVIAGSEDALIPKEQTEQLHRGILNSHLVVVQKSGHMLNLEQPHEFRNALRRFLEEIR